ncbi:hypothetical protein QYE76_066636 [Lolium multiflorum]|uniref:Rubredoxin-like domain-containing protein n=1 Tax=Lolium multiflorum TaxID=4521 RepID=A0AAD8SAW4_LOLMU|nr:hypothetical protein QYE76_066636 [Lolium multiflorum]
MAVQVQAQSLLRAPAGRPALRSVFCALPLSVRMPSPTRATFWEAARITMRFGGVASKQAYICRDCGYIYKDRTPFEKLSDDYYCPVCAAPKRRFRPYEQPVAKNANATDARKARKGQLKKDESVGKALPIGIAVGIVALAALFFYLNSVY